MTLKGWWPLHDEKAQDYSGNQNHGTLNGGPTTGVAGRGGLQATSFDGADDYIEYGTPNIAPKGGSQPFTVSFWIRWTGGAAEPIPLDLRHQYDWFIRLNDNGNGKLKLHNYDGSNKDGIFSSTTIPKNEWIHCVARYNGDGTGEWFLDGEQDVSASIQTDVATAGDSLQIAASDGNNHNFGGQLFGIRIYSRALSDAEIRTLYKWGSADLARPPTDGVARYPLDGDANDVWGSNDGTTNGSISWSNDAIRGQAANFDGSDDQINTGSNIFDGGDCTISLWVKPRNVSNNQQLILDQDNSNGDLRANISIANSTSGNIEYHFYTGGTSYEGSIPLPLKEWSHFCVSFNSSKGAVDMYQNGERRQSDGGTANAEGVYPSLIIGAARESGKNNYNGLLDDVRIYPRALSQSEVFKLYQWGTRGKDLRKHLVNRRQK